ncbi:MAG: ABC transporter substrate-binding protein [Dehalococcoidia bacterium]
MATDNYWLRNRSRFGRRRVLQAAASASVGLAGLAAVGCGDDDDDTSGSSPTAAGATTAPTPAEQADLTATLTAGIGSDIGSGDPQSLAGTGGGNWPSYATHFITPLTTNRDTSEVVGYAADWEWADNNTAILLKAKPGLKFHNGEPINAAQFKFNIDRELGRAEYNPKFASGHKSQFTSIGEVSIVDELTARLEVIQPDVILPSKLAGSMFLVPKDYVVAKGDTEFGANPVGAGPFKFESRTADSQIKSVRYDDFFYGRDQQFGPRLPWIQTLVQKVIPEDAARIAALETGEIDLAHNVSADLAKSFEGRSGFKVYSLPGDQPMHIHINTMLETGEGGGPNPWRDVRVRKAANLAVDLDTIIKTILTGTEKRSFGSAQRSLGFPQDLPAKQFKYDPAAAKALLAEAGYADGFTTSLNYPTGRWPNTEAVVQAVANYLGKVGIKANLQAQQYQVTTTAFKQKTSPGLTFFGMSGGDDPGPNFRYGYHSKGAYTMSTDPALGLDALIEQSEAAFDVEKRKALIGQIITKFYENASWIFLYEPVTIAIADDKKLQWTYYNKVLSNPEYWNIKVVKS